jgi:hypothetical protein
LDQGKGSKIDKNAHFDERFTYQVWEWKKIANDKLQKPWKVDAAQKVLNYLQVT